MELQGGQVRLEKHTKTTTKMIARRQIWSFLVNLHVQLLTIIKMDSWSFSLYTICCKTILERYLTMDRKNSISHSTFLPFQNLCLSLKCSYVINK